MHTGARAQAAVLVVVAEIVIVKDSMSQNDINHGPRIRVFSHVRIIGVPFVGVAYTLIPSYHIRCRVYAYTVQGICTVLRAPNRYLHTPCRVLRLYLRGQIPESRHTGTASAFSRAEIAACVLVVDGTASDVLVSLHAE